MWQQCAQLNTTGQLCWAGARQGGEQVKHVVHQLTPTTTLHLRHKRLHQGEGQYQTTVARLRHTNRCILLMGMWCETWSWFHKHNLNSMGSTTTWVNGGTRTKQVQPLPHSAQRWLQAQSTMHLSAPANTPLTSTGSMLTYTIPRLRYHCTSASKALLHL
jgi:hypothetical protein